MNLLHRLLLALIATMLSGCSYITSFVICNVSGSDITISYRTKERGSYHGFFSTSLDIYLVTMNGDEAVLGEVIPDVPWSEENGITITIPTGTAVRTGDDAGASEKGSYSDLDYLMIVQGSDTSTFRGSVLPSVVQHLGDQQKGLVLR